MAEDTSRRHLFTGTVLIAGGMLTACAKQAGQEKEVGAVEDLMREHGILRRALLVYEETVSLLRSAPDKVDAGALNKTARLFQDFGENYHEKQLEEAYIFPRVRKAGGRGAALVDPLLAQHQRGREITQFILRSTATGKIASAAAEPLAMAFETFVRMYENHAAREDTIVFPAWKNALSGHELDELGEKFEDIEKKQFGGDGFDMAERQMSDIETALGFADLGRFTAPPVGS